MDRNQFSNLVSPTLYVNKRSVIWQLWCYSQLMGSYLSAALLCLLRIPANIPISIFVFGFWWINWVLSNVLVLNAHSVESCFLTVEYTRLSIDGTIFFFFECLHSLNTLRSLKLVNILQPDNYT